MDRSIKQPNQSSNPTGAPAGNSEKVYLGQVSSSWWEDAEYLSMRKAIALCPECALNVSTPVHSSMHAGSVCVCGWFNVPYSRKHCLREAGAPSSNLGTPTIKSMTYVRCCLEKCGCGPLLTPPKSKLFISLNLKFLRLTGSPFWWRNIGEYAIIWLPVGH